MSDKDMPCLFKSSSILSHTIKSLEEFLGSPKCLSDGLRDLTILFQEWGFSQILGRFRQ